MPTITTNALLLSILNDAIEWKDVATTDVAGAYLKAYLNYLVLMKFTGKFGQHALQLNPEQEKFVVTKNRVKVLYIHLIKAIYRCVKAAFLWYEMLSIMLKNMGFVLNPYNPCIDNCMFEVKKCTTVWYVDDNKISHKYPKVVSMIVDHL